MCYSEPLDMSKRIVLTVLNGAVAVSSQELPALREVSASQLLSVGTGS